MKPLKLLLPFRKVTSVFDTKSTVSTMSFVATGGSGTWYGE